MKKIPCLEHLTVDQTLWVLAQWEINQIWAVKDYLFYAGRPPDSNQLYFRNEIARYYKKYFSL